MVSVQLTLCLRVVINHIGFVEHINQRHTLEYNKTKYPTSYETWFPVEYTQKSVPRPTTRNI